MSYVKGRAKEHYVIEKLKRLGADLIIRSSRSLGPADLVAVFLEKREIWFIQVKYAKEGVNIEKLREKYKELEALRGQFTCKSGFYARGKTGWIADLQ